MATDQDRIMVGLSSAQADGLACVICGRLFEGGDGAHQPVGRSESGSQVFAHVGACTGETVRRQRG